MEIMLMVVDQTESSCRELPGFSASQETKDRLKLTHWMPEKYEEHVIKYYWLKKKNKKRKRNWLYGNQIFKINIAVREHSCKIIKVFKLKKKKILTFKWKQTFESII